MIRYSTIHFYIDVTNSILIIYFLCVVHSQMMLLSILLFNMKPQALVVKASSLLYYNLKCFSCVEAITNKFSVPGMLIKIWVRICRNRYIYFVSPCNASFRNNSDTKSNSKEKVNEKYTLLCQKGSSLLWLFSIWNKIRVSWVSTNFAVSVSKILFCVCVSSIKCEEIKHKYSSLRYLNNYLLRLDTFSFLWENCLNMGYNLNFKRIWVQFCKILLKYAT